MEHLFFDHSGKKLKIQEIVFEMAAFMKEDERRRYRITVGTDSQRLEDNTAEFATAIVIHRIGNGARYFWKRHEIGKFFTLRDRIIQEALYSIDIAKEILTALKKADTPLFSFEVHVDVGEKGETKAVIQEVTGMVTANNFQVRIKPNSYAASNVADRHV